MSDDTTRAAVDPHRLQCAIVAMLYDESYADRIFGNDSLDDVTPTERQLLRTIDRRALTTDPFRCARAVQTMIEEFPVTAAMLGTQFVAKFFASEAFRLVVRTRGSMAVEFGRWVGKRAHGIGRLEGAMALARRALSPPRGSTGVLCSPGVRALSVAKGTLAFHSRIRSRLGPDPLTVLTAGDFAVHGGAPRNGVEHLLIQRRQDGSLDVGTASAALVSVITFVETPRSREQLAQEVVRLGALPTDFDALFADWLAEGLLCCVDGG